MTISPTLMRGIIISLLINPILSADSSPVAPDSLSYSELADSYTRSFGVAAQVPVPVNPKKVQLNVVPLSKQEKVRTLFGIYSAPTNDMVKITPLRSLLKDLDIFYGQGSDCARHIFGCINQTHTVFGEVALARMISEPLSDINQLRSRQELIKELVINEKLAEELQAIMERVHHVESEILSFWQEDNKPTKELINNSAYLSGTLGRSLNDSPVVMETVTRMSNLTHGALMAVPCMIPAALVWLSQRSYQDPYGNAIQLPEGTYKTFLKNYFDPRFYINESQGGEFKLNMGSTAGSLVYGGLHGLQLYIAKKGYDSGVRLYSAIHYLHQRLNGVACLVHSLKAIDTLAQDCPALKQGLLQSGVIHAAFDPAAQEHAPIKSLLALLQTNTFKSEPTAFALSGRVLAAFTQMQYHKNDFISLMQAFGEVDACLSIAKLFKKYRDERVVYSFVNYIDQATPCVSMQDFWNPMVDVSCVVPNSIELGLTPRNIIITGSNTGGKSTILKAMMINIVCAQTLTIVPARSLTMTPFSFLGTSLNIADDTAAGNSLYQAEVNRAQALMQGAASLRGNNFGFIVIDELFRGTSPDKAEEGTYECALRFGGCSNCMMVLATHFVTKTTQLEQQTSGVFKNYKIEVRKDDQGNIVRPYKLEPGINTAHIADTLLHNALDSIKENLPNA